MYIFISTPRKYGGGGWLIKRVYGGGVVDVIILTVRGECGRVNI